MRFATTFAAVAVVLTAALAGAQQNVVKRGAPMRPGMTVADWQKMYDKAEQMFDHKDADALFKYMAPGFTITMGGKTMNSAEAKKGMATWFKMMKTVHCTMKVVKATGGGMNATVTDRFRNAGDMILKGKSAKTGKYVDVGTETATWVKTKGQWMMKSLVTDEEKVTLDGKPLKPGM